MKTLKNKKQDQEWVEKNILKGGDILFYGTLAEDFSNVFAEEFWKELRKHCEEYLHCSQDRSQSFHHSLDEKISSLIERDKRFGYPPPFCHKGCADCCHEVIYCTSEEAELIHKHCEEKKIKIDYQKLERQLHFIETDDKLDHTGVTRWNDQLLEDQSCIFLDPQEKSCKIWEVRPFVCRVHLAEKTNAYCKPHNGVTNPKACGISYPEWSYPLTAIFTIHKDSIKKTMGRLLLHLKKNTHDFKT